MRPATGTVGVSGSVISVAPDGTATTLIPAIPSYASPSETIGIYRAIPDGTTLWLVYSAAVPGAPLGDAVIALDTTTMTITQYIYLGVFEVENNPDGNEVNSNVSDVARVRWDALHHRCRARTIC